MKKNQLRILKLFSSIWCVPLLIFAVIQYQILSGVMIYDSVEHVKRQISVCTGPWHVPVAALTTILCVWNWSKIHYWVITSESNSQKPLTTPCHQYIPSLVAILESNYIFLTFHNSSTVWRCPPRYRCWRTLPGGQLLVLLYVVVQQSALKPLGSWLNIILLTQQFLFLRKRPTIQNQEPGTVAEVFVLL